MRSAAPALAPLLALATALAGCAAAEEAPPLDDASSVRRLYADPEIEVLAVSHAPPLAETDQPSTLDVVLRDRRSGAEVTVLARGMRDAAFASGKLFAVDEAGRLWLIEGDDKRALLDGAGRGITLLPDGSVVVVRAGDEPGETDLWRVTPAGRSSPLAAAPGPDDMPTALEDGRVLFVSGRTSVASLFIVDPDTSEVTQLTNRGLVAGGARAGFVPPPASSVDQQDGVVEYDAGDGERWQVSLRDGSAERLTP